MSSLGLWSIEEGGPRRLTRGDVGLEQYLESWIEKDPALVREGLTIVGRQMTVEGGRLDLLAIDMQGRWVIIEIKGGRLNRETIAQALDYASCIADMPYDDLAQRTDAYLQTRDESLAALMSRLQIEVADLDERRELQIFIVGTGVDPGLQRMVNFLSDSYQMSVGVVSFDIFEVTPGQQILMRELDERELSPAAAPTARPEVTLERVLADARQHGVEPAFHLCLEAAERNDLYPRLYKSSIMFTPPTNRTRCLFTIWTKPFGDGRVKLFVASDVFAEFYPLAEDEIVAALGPGGWRQWSVEEVAEFAASLDRLFATMQ